MEIEVVDVYLNVAWAWQWEMKSQFNGDQKKTILCQKILTLACFTTFLMLLSLSYLVPLVLRNDVRQVSSTTCTCFERKLVPVHRTCDF